MTPLRLLMYVSLVLCLAGCQGVKRTPSALDAPDVIHYAGNPPVLIFIPIPALTDDFAGYPAQIALPAHRDFTTNALNVAVSGEVLSPGLVTLRSGSTVLQAIVAAGGLTPSAFTKRLSLRKSSGQSVSLYRHSRRTAGDRYRLVWCDVTREDSGHVAPVDYILDPGD